MELITLGLKPVTPRIVRAVGYAHKHGVSTLDRDLQRFLARQFCKIVYSSQHVFEATSRLDKAMKAFGIPVDWRDRVLAYTWSLWPILMIGGAAKGGTYEGDLLSLLFNATTIANVAINATSSPLTNLYVALHTSDPGTGGNQQTNEVGYTSYARVAVIRDNTGWTVTGTGPASCSPVATVSFPQGTGGSGTVSFFSVGSLVSGTGKVFYSGTVTPNIVTGNGVTPQLTTATTITES